MRLKLLAVFIAITLCAPALAQVRPAFESSQSSFSIGGGTDYWKGDWSHVARYGPAAWSTTELRHGFGICADGYSMMAGGDTTAQEYKYFVGEGGGMYIVHWHRLAPFAKGELGFASLGFPHKPKSTYAHDTRTTWAVGGGTEMRLTGPIWLHLDFTYDGFPDFYSPVTGQHHTLNQDGVAAGLTYHLTGRHSSERVY